MNRWSPIRGTPAQSAEVLEAIRRGEVDAVVVTGESGERLFSLHPLDIPYQQLFDALTESALVLDPEGRIIFCNGAFCRLIGVTTAEIEQALLKDLVIPEHQSRLEDLLKTSAPTVQAEIGLKGPQDAIKVQIGLSPLPDAFFPDGEDKSQPGGGGFVAIVKGGAQDPAEVREQLLAGQAEDLASGIVAARDEERSHLSDEMNDVVLPVLNDALFDLDWIEEKLRWSENRPHSSVFARLVTVRDQLTRLSLRARRYDPPALARLGLIGALEARVHAVAEREGVNVTLSADLGTAKLDRGRELRVYRLVDEILMGLSLPSLATRITIDLASTGGTLNLIARDNGKVVEGRHNPRRAAVFAMIRTQVEGMGGEMEVGLEGQGTLISVIIPAAAPVTG